MASVYKKRGRYYVRWKDAAGRWRRQVTACHTKREAERDAEDLERQAERARDGLEPLPGDGPRMTFGELLDLWWKDYGSKLRSTALLPSINKHLRTPLGALPLREVTAARIEALWPSATASLRPRR